MLSIVRYVLATANTVQTYTIRQGSQVGGFIPWLFTYYLYTLCYSKIDVKIGQVCLDRKLVFAASFIFFTINLIALIKNEYILSDTSGDGGGGDGDDDGNGDEGNEDNDGREGGENNQ